VANPFVLSIARNFKEALRLMEAALTDCPGDLWETGEALTSPTSRGGLHGSTARFLEYHGLLTLDYELSAEIEPFEPPHPSDEYAHAFDNSGHRDSTELCSAAQNRVPRGCTDAVGDVLAM
jgi:hypothetical protein